MTTQSEAEDLDYFWSEKGDVKRWTGYEEWACANPMEALRLGERIAEVEHAKRRVGMYLSVLKHTATKE